MKVRKQNKNKQMLLRTVNQDRDWDYSFIYKLLYRKLSNVLAYAQSETVSDEESWRLPWLKRAIALCDILIKEYIPHDKYVNIHNAKRFREARKFKFNHTGISNLWRYEEESLYLIKAKHLFFKIMANYIENWWD